MKKITTIFERLHQIAECDIFNIIFCICYEIIPLSPLLTSTIPIYNFDINLLLPYAGRSHKWDGHYMCLTVCYKSMITSSGWFIHHIHSITEVRLGRESYSISPKGIQYRLCYYHDILLLTQINSHCTVLTNSSTRFSQGDV